jgi:hypothetical protein
VVLVEGEVVDMTRLKIGATLSYPSFYSYVKSLDRGWYERLEVRVYPACSTENHLAHSAGAEAPGTSTIILRRAAVDVHD